MYSAANIQPRLREILQVIREVRAVDALLEAVEAQVEARRPRMMRLSWRM
jgi:hypothetical protein